MRIEIEQKLLYEGIQTVNKAVSSKTTLPILSGILLKTENNKLKLVGTDLEIGIECIVNGEVKKEGSIVLPAKYLVNIIRELPNKKVILTTDSLNNTAQIKCEQANFNIHGSAADEFPLLPKVDGETNFSIEQNKFKNIIDQVKFAISQDESKPFLTGALLIIENNTVKLVATDTYRLAYREDKITDSDINHKKVIIPEKTLTEISKLLDYSEEKVNIIITDNQVIFEFEKAIIISRLIEGQFPNYQQVIPKKNNTKITVNRKEFLSAVKRTALLARKDSNIIKINLEKEKLIITSNTPEIGQAYEKIDISLIGQETEIAFNSIYLMDCLKAIESDSVILELSGALSPGLIKPKNEEDYIYVIMPVRS